MPFLNNDKIETSLPPDFVKKYGDGDAFQWLVHDLSAALGPSSGLDSDDVDPIDIQRLMECYESNATEWSKYALGDPSRKYTRNLVDEGNGKSNLVGSATGRDNLAAAVIAGFSADPMPPTSSSSCGPQVKEVQSMIMPMLTVL